MPPQDIWPGAMSPSHRVFSQIGQDVVWAYTMPSWAVCLPHISSTVSNTSKGPVPPQKVESQYIHLHSLFKTERRSRKFEPRWRVNTPMIFQTGPFCARSNRCPIPDDHALKSLTQTSSDGLLADFCDCGLPLPALPARLTLRLRGGVSPETGARGSKPGV